MTRRPMRVAHIICTAAALLVYVHPGTQAAAGHLHVSAKWLGAYLKAHPDELKVAKLADHDDVILNGSTDELQTFITRTLRTRVFWTKNLNWRARDPATQPTTKAAVPGDAPPGQLRHVDAPRARRQTRNSLMTPPDILGGRARGRGKPVGSCSVRPQVCRSRYNKEPPGPFRTRRQIVLRTA